MAKKFSMFEKLLLAGVAAGAGYGLYRFMNRNAAVAGMDETGDTDGEGTENWLRDPDADGKFNDVVSTHSARAARERSRVAREEAKQARLSARGQRRRAVEAKALADRRAKEAIAAEQYADTKERMLRHTEALDADIDLYT